MKYGKAVWASTAASVLLFLPVLAHGQQGTQLQWQGPLPSSSILQSSTPANSSQHFIPQPTQRSVPSHPQPPPATSEQPSRQGDQLLRLQEQAPVHPNVQEIPAVWQPSAPPTLQPPTPRSATLASPSPSTPGYVGLRGRDFYRTRFCMHALTVQGVEVVTIEPNSPAARAGLRPAQPLTAREVAIGAAAGVMTISRAEPLAAGFVRISGGMNHGDIILAVAGRRVKTLNEFQQELARFGPRAVVYFTVRRGESVIQLPVRFTRGPDSVASVTMQEAKAAIDQ